MKETPRARWGEGVILETPVEICAPEECSLPVGLGLSPVKETPA